MQVLLPQLHLLVHQIVHGAALAPSAQPPPSLASGMGGLSVSSRFNGDVNSSFSGGLTGRIGVLAAVGQVGSPLRCAVCQAVGAIVSHVKHAYVTVDLTVGSA